MIFTDKDRNGLLILKKCFAFFSRFHIALVFALLIIIFNLSLIGTVLYYEYMLHGINIFEPKTIYNLLELDVWDHIIRIFYALCFLACSSFFTALCTTAMTFTILQHINKKPHGFFIACKVSFSKVIMVTHTAFILVIDRFNTFLDVIFIQGMLQRMADYLQAKHHKPLITLHSPEGYLFFPIITQTNEKVPEALEESERLMVKTFGDTFSYNISFNAVKFAILFAVLATFGISIHYHYNLLPAVIISTVLILMLYTLIESVLSLFRACVYNYTKKRPTGPFTKKEITLYFK